METKNDHLTGAIKTELQNLLNENSCIFRLTNNNDIEISKMLQDHSTKKKALQFTHLTSAKKAKFSRRELLLTLWLILNDLTPLLSQILT